MAKTRYGVEVKTTRKPGGHEWFKCPDVSGESHRTPCRFCDGGLGWCIRCDGAEIELTKTCPGRKLTREERAAITDGRLNFVNGRWIRKTVGARGGTAYAAVSKTVGLNARGGSNPPAPTKQKRD